MHQTSEYLGVLMFTLAFAVNHVYGTEGCSSVQTYSNPVINMCEGGSWTSKTIYISVTNSSMGSNTSCSCSVTQTAQGQSQPSFNLEYVNNTIPKCTETSLTVDWPGARALMTCTSHRGIKAGADTAEAINVTLSRPDVSHGVDYCLSISHSSDSSLRTLSCNGGIPPPSPASPTTVSPTTAPQTGTTSPSSSTATSTSETLSSSSPSSTSEASSTPQETGTPAAGTTSGAVPSDSSQQNGGNGSGNFPTAAVAGGIAGGCVLIIIVVLIVVCMRKKRQVRTPQEERSGGVNRGYENVLTDNILYESSSGLANNQSPPSSQPTMTNGEGAYKSVDENGKSPSVTYYNTSGGVASVSTGNEKENPIFGATNDYAIVDETTSRKSGAEPKRTSAPPPATPSAPAPAAAAAAAVAAAAAAPAAAAPAAEPPSDQYAVVNKPLRQKKPTQNAAAKSKSANVTLPSGDVYAVVDRSTNRGSEPGPAHSPPPEVSPPPAPAPAATPGLVYADLDLVTTPRSSAGIPAPPTDYAEIDHEASARL